MTEKPGSLQDLIRRRQQSGFVGRLGQLVQFQEDLSLAVDDHRRKFIFNIHGDAGVGKTYLVKQLQQLAVRNGALTAYIDETTEDTTAAMIAIARQFAVAGTRLGGFEKRADAYQRRRHELESDPDAPDGLATFLTKTAVTIGLAAARDVPFGGSLLAQVDPTAAAEQANRARAYLARRLGAPADLRLLLSPADELTPVFVAELNRIATTRPIVLFIDTYERTGLALGRWLRRLYGGEYGELPPTLFTTISGEEPLSPNLWGDYLPVIEDVPLEPFSDVEARQFLSSKGISDEAMIQAILSSSGRLPLWLATLADARPSSISEIGDPTGDAVERFLRWEDDPGRRRVAMAAALPRAVNQDVLAEITSPEEAEELFGWLCGLPFISRRGDSWVYHEVVRAAMLRLQRTQAPSEWSSQQDVLAQAYERWAREVAADDDRDWSDPHWIDFTREQTYHLLCANPEASLRGALTSAVKAAGHSTLRAREWAQLIADAGSDTDHVGVREWGQRLSDGIHDDDLTKYLTELISDANLDNGTLSIALDQRGKSNRLAGRYNDALADLTRAIELNPEYAGAIAGRSVTYLLMGRYDDALADFTRAIELDPGQAWAIASRGETYRLMGRYDDALADFTRAIELDPGQAWAIASRGQTYRLMGRYDDALADFTRAIELDPGQAWAIASRGQTYRLMKRYDDALADVTHALGLDPEYTWAIAHRGETYRLMGRYDDALADFTRAIELDPGQAWAIASRGETYRLMGRYDDALADFTRAIELDPGQAWAIASRGQTYQAMGRYDDALADLTRAIDLNPKYTRAIASRGQTYEAMGRYDDALTDLTRALDLNPEYTRAIASVVHATTPPPMSLDWRDQATRQFSDIVGEELRSLLSNHYFRSAEVAALVRQAGGSPALINWDQPMSMVWLDVLTTLASQGKLRQLVQSLTDGPDEALVDRLHELMADLPATDQKTWKFSSEAARGEPVDKLGDLSHHREQEVLNVLLSLMWPLRKMAIRIFGWMIPHTALAVLQRDHSALQEEALWYIETEINRAYTALGPPPGLDESA